MPKDVPWHGKTVHTGVYKQTVAGPRMVRRLNIDGDGQGDLGGHGGEQRAVLVYQLDSYRFWEKKLGRDELAPGAFGENFTVDGLPDDEVCIGDRYRIGGALFEVTQPRVTCYRVGLRMGEPQMAALLVAHHRPGFYLRVIEEGEVEAGQDIVKESTGPEAMSVEELDRVLYLPGHTREQVERALRIPALSPGWQESMKTLLDQDDSQEAGGSSGSAGLNAAATAPPPAWPGFRPLTVTHIQPESRSVFSLRLAAADGSELPAALPGQFITVKVQPEGGAPPLIRSYSLSGEPGTGTYRISVKVEPHGAASNELRAHIRVGDRLEAAAPRGTFCLADGDNPVLLLSAGVGATPVLAMLHALARDRSTRPVWWLHGARDGTEHPFAQESHDLVSALPDARSTVYYSKPNSADRQGVDYAATGRLAPEPVRRLGLPTDADAYLCGPTAFMDSLTAALVDYGLDASRVHTEIFGSGAAITPGIKGAAAAAAPHQPAGPAGAGPQVSFARSGLNVPWNDAQESLLELAEACDVPVQWSCRTGVCHTCELALMSGSVDYSPDPVEPPGDGNILICCSKPAGEVVLDL
ncbi:MOSC and FAD-binding oxidoreductase domain-containing protein [Streptomyces cocklensis]|nr:MOSC and FAD-binding oxidoreductase domain-containing protein [Actinacidiphila cocklensis]MDD1059848.1 MOSC and FAD-binding oxidoreductase domain-containing protein [Actinacidiphila cocklensis]WSX72716.1 MOSC and FAD-binding oxidoreductase domain-containing protein [Streptomyces sp. NBC_00899]WSX81216.1 MOSC and FAD-binding oxidoreductase domain-containing protein [Streptomyces sp. NBC_00899]